MSVYCRILNCWELPSHNSWIRTVQDRGATYRNTTASLSAVIHSTRKKKTKKTLAKVPIHPMANLYWRSSTSNSSIPREKELRRASPAGSCCYQSAVCQSARVTRAVSFIDGLLRNLWKFIIEWLQRNRFPLFIFQKKNPKNNNINTN